MPARRKATNAPEKSAATIGFEAKLWFAADKLRITMDAAEYKHALPGHLLHNMCRQVCLWFSGQNESAVTCRAVSEFELALAA